MQDRQDDERGNLLPDINLVPGQQVADRNVMTSITSACTAPDTDVVYLVPDHDVPDRGACLRVKPTKNNQAKGVRWAKDYVLGDKVKVADAAG